MAWRPGWQAACGAWLLALTGCAAWPSLARAQDGDAAAPPLVGRQAWMLDRLQALADADSLADPVKVGAILGVKFDKTVSTTSPSHMESFARTFERIEYTPATRAWFAADTLAADPLAAGDTVHLLYYQSKRFGLPETSDMIVFDNLRDDRQDSLLLRGLDKFACITLADVQRRFPGLTHMQATDVGAEQYLYYPPPREESGTVLAFRAPRGRCVAEASVQEFSGFGKRHARAQSKFIGCVREAAQAYCAGHPEAAAAGFQVGPQVEAFAREKCVSLNAFHDREPRTNEPAPGKVEYPELPWRCGAAK